jgi:phosphatidylglycerol:prolipoprotein diacylglycerol transferase
VRWSIDPILAQLGVLELRWYGLFFATGLLLCAWKAPKYYAMWGLPKQHAERLTLWVPVGMLLGAHYIHLIFYEPHGLLDFPRFEDGRFVLGRFLSLGSGLASHGGALGCILALWIFWRRYARPLDIPFHRYADATMMAAVWVFPWVRVGNFFNSEILGRPTDSPFGVIFVDRGYDTPLHPVQLYEAAMYFAEVAFATLWWNPRFARRLRPGTTFYFFLMLHFSLRFVAEFFKESQGVDEGWALNMGHLLSLPIVLVCAYLLFFTKRFNLLAPLTLTEKEAIDASAERAAEHEAALDATARAARGDAEDASTSASRKSDGRAGSGAKKKKKKSKKRGRDDDDEPRAGA